MITPKTQTKNRISTSPSRKSTARDIVKVKRRATKQSSMVTKDLRLNTFYGGISDPIFTRLFNRWMRVKQWLIEFNSRGMIECRECSSSSFTDTFDL